MSSLKTELEFKNKQRMGHSTASDTEQLLAAIKEFAPSTLRPAEDAPAAPAALPARPAPAAAPAAPRPRSLLSDIASFDRSALKAAAAAAAAAAPPALPPTPVLRPRGGNDTTALKSPAAAKPSVFSPAAFNPAQARNALRRTGVRKD